MGDLTRTQLEDEVRFRVGDRTDINARITLAVQSAYDELVTSIRVPENQETSVMTTADGQSIYPGPTDLYAIVSIRNNTDGERLVPLDIRRYDRIDQTLSGKPTHYIWWRNEIIYTPIPDSTIRTMLMRYVRRLAGLTQTGTVTALPREWDEVVIQGAYFRTLRWLQLKTEAQAEQVEYMTMVQRRLDRLQEGMLDEDAGSRPIFRRGDDL